MDSAGKIDFEAFRSVDVEEVDPSSLVDIRDVEIDTSLPLPERIAGYIAQIKNPYCFKCGGAVVKLKFMDTDITMEERMESYFRSL